MSDYRAYAAYRFEIDKYGIHLVLGDDLVLQPVQLEWEKVDPLVAHPPAFYLSEDAARALHDALGAALGLHLSDTKFAREVLEREQNRVDILLKKLGIDVT